MSLPKIGGKDPPTLVDKGKGKAIDPMTIENEYTPLRNRWREEYTDIMEGTKPGLPPWREVNHEINIINDNKRYNYYLPCCPHALREELHEKINHYVEAGWWEPKSISQAAPLLSIWKKDTKLRTVIDACQCNNNTIKDVTPLLDQEVIREDVARAKFRSKVDLLDTYEQVCIRIEDIDKTAFATISGTLCSKGIVMPLRHFNS
jgi:hypothetical protein